MPYSLGIEKRERSLKQATDFHLFRDRNLGKEIQKSAFNTSLFLSKAASIDRALKEASRFETDKFYTKKKFIFREPQLLKSPNRRFNLSEQTENQRVNQTILSSVKLDNGSYDASKMVKPDAFRGQPLKQQWRTKDGFSSSPKSQTQLKSMDHLPDMSRP